MQKRANIPAKGKTHAKARADVKPVITDAKPRIPVRVRVAVRQMVVSRASNYQNMTSR
jgi:hypothetical protein